MQWLIDIIQAWLQIYLKGMIVIWAGAIVDIPAGWHLCDGTEDTPDLRDRFIVGAGAFYNPDDTGGAVSHTHPFTTVGHKHTLAAGGWIAAGEDFDDETTSNVVTGTTDPKDNLPPYYALAYIMKL